MRARASPLAVPSRWIRRGVVAPRRSPPARPRCRALQISLHNAGSISTRRCPMRLLPGLLKRCAPMGCTKRSSPEPFGGIGKRCPGAASIRLRSGPARLLAAVRGLTRRGRRGGISRAPVAALKNPATCFCHWQCPGEADASLQAGVIESAFRSHVRTGLRAKSSKRLILKRARSCPTKERRDHFCNVADLKRLRIESAAQIVADLTLRD